MATQWYYAQNGQQSGPLTSDQLREMLATGAVKATDLVWSEGMPAWAPANQVPGLMPIPAVAPPPAAYVPAPAAYVPPPAPAYVAPVAPAYNPPPAYAQPVAQAQSQSQSQAQAYAASSVRGGVSEAAVALLRQTKPWVRFLSVLGFLGLGLLGLGCLVVMLFPFGALTSMSMGPRIAFAFVYLLLGFLHLPPVLFLHRYASRIAKLVATGAPSDLEDALRAQKSFWKYVGVFTLVVMVIYILVLLGVLIFAGASMFNR